MLYSLLVVVDDVTVVVVVVVFIVECVSQAVDWRTDWFYGSAHICDRQEHYFNGLSLRSIYLIVIHKTLYLVLILSLCVCVRVCACVCVCVCMCEWQWYACVQMCIHTICPSVCVMTNMHDSGLPCVCLEILFSALNVC